MTLRSLREGFIKEAREHIEAITTKIVDFANEPLEFSDILRHVHTLKGSAGTVGANSVGKAAHQLEECLIKIKDHNLILDDPLIDMLLSVMDFLKEIVETETTEQQEALLKNFEHQIGLLNNKLNDLKGIKNRGLSRCPSLVIETVDIAKNIQQKSTDVIKVNAKRIEEIMEGIVRLDAITDGLILENTTATSLRNTIDMLKEKIQSIRMMPMRHVFEKLHRPVRDMARTEKKSIKLSVLGESVEIDSLIEGKISALLLHLVRNAVAHGIETPAQRREVGKSESGNLKLSAQKQENFLILEVEDDGAGIDLDLLREKVPQEWKNAGTEEELLDLLFTSGFTTRTQADDLAGRGVGLDVVRKNVVDLGGEIKVRSRVGQGTCFSIRIPSK